MSLSLCLWVRQLNQYESLHSPNTLVTTSMFGDPIKSTPCVIVFIFTDTNKRACLCDCLWILDTTVCCQFLGMFKQPSQVASISSMTDSISIHLRTAPSLRLNLAVTDLLHLHAFYWCSLLYQAPFCRWPEPRASSFLKHFAKPEMVELNWYPVEEGC